jgi:ABC-2 type transport system permease protein
MAGLIPVNVRDQFAAIAQLRWRLFRNSLRSRRGKADFFAQLLMGAGFSIFGLVGAIGLGGGAFYFISEHKTAWLPALLWPVFLFWQFFPIVATAFTENLESSDLLRFPLGYRSYFLVRLAYGLFDPATLIACFWLVAITVGIGLANPVLLPWTILVLLIFAGFNILLTRTIFSWVERWLARRRTREILGMLFFVVIIGLQFIGPAIERYSHHSTAHFAQGAKQVAVIQQILPPGLAAASIANFGNGKLPSSALQFAGLLGYASVLLWLLNFRLLAQYRGENLSEAEAVKTRAGAQPTRLAWKLPGVSGPVSAVFEKEVRILSRSGPILLTIIMPIVALFIFRIGHWHAGTQNIPNLALRPQDFGFPVGAIYSLLILTNLVYNSFGAEGMGVQLYLVSPVRFRQIILGKNLAYALILIVSLTLLWFTVNLVYGHPAPAMVVATLSGLLFAAPINFAGGNLFSLYSPKQVDYGTFGRQKASQLTVLASIGIQILIFGLGAVTVILARMGGSLWYATPVFLLLAAIAIALYFFVLRQVDQIALEHRETLVAELGKS